MICADLSWKNKRPEKRNNFLNMFLKLKKKSYILLICSKPISYELVPITIRCSELPKINMEESNVFHNENHIMSS